MESSLPLEFSDDGLNYPTLQQHDFSMGMCRGLCTFPQDRLSLYGGSLATGRPGLKSPKISAKWLDYTGPLRVEGTSGHYRVLQQLSRLRSEAKEVFIAEGTVRENASKGEFLMMLQKVGGEKTHAEIVLGERLLAEARDPHRDIQELLNQRADPLFRDWAGNIPLHMACTEEHVRNLLQARLEMASALNLTQQAPLSAILTNYRERRRYAEQFFLAILFAFREMCGIAPFFAFCQHSQSTPFGLLSAPERASLKMPFTWDKIKGSFIGNSYTLLVRSLRHLCSDILPYASTVVDGIMHFMLFEDESGQTQIMEQRLQQIWAAIRTLLQGAAHACNKESSGSILDEDVWQLARWLLKLSRSMESGSRDPRRPYRGDLALCLAELHSQIGASLNHIYNTTVLRRHVGQNNIDISNRLEIDDAHWLQSTPPLDGIVENLLAPLEGFGRPFLRSQLQIVCEPLANSFRQSPQEGQVKESNISKVLLGPAMAPSWLKTKCLDVAIQDLQSLGVDVSLINLVNAVADAKCIDDASRIAHAFAWLHTVRLCRLHEIAMNEMKQACDKVLAPRSGGASAVSVNYPERVRSFEQVWSDAQNYWEVRGTAQDRPADFVCDITCVSAVYSEIAGLRACYNACEKLDWNSDGVVLVRIANGFHRGNVDPRGHYRSCVVWLVISTSVGPLVAQLELHLVGFYEKREAALLLDECVRGVFEPQAFRKPWSQLLCALSDLRSAIDASSEIRLRDALQRTKEILNLHIFVTLKNDTAIRERITAAEQSLLALASDNRNLRSRKDLYETCVESYTAPIRQSWITEVANAQIARCMQLKQSSTLTAPTPPLPAALAPSGFPKPSPSGLLYATEKMPPSSSPKTSPSGLISATAPMPPSNSPKAGLLSATAPMPPSISPPKASPSGLLSAKAPMPPSSFPTPSPSSLLSATATMPPSSSPKVSPSGLLSATAPMPPSSSPKASPSGLLSATAPMPPSISPPKASPAGLLSATAPMPPSSSPKPSSSATAPIPPGSSPTPSPSGILSAKAPMPPSSSSKAAPSGLLSATAPMPPSSSAPKASPL